jgi:hypothetical protein
LLPFGTDGAPRADYPDHRSTLANAVADEEHPQPCAEAQQDEPILGLRMVGILDDQGIFV